MGKGASGTTIAVVVCVVVVAAVAVGAILFLGSGSNACGVGNESTTKGICLEMNAPQFQIGFSRRLGSARSLAELQNSDSDLYEFSCKNGTESTCDVEDDCNAAMFAVSGAFSLPAGEDGATEDCGYVRMIQDFEVQEYEFDYACGCDEDTYLEPNNTCGQYRVGMDVYTQNEGWGDDTQTTEYEGETWTYIRQSDIEYKSDLVEVLTAFRNGDIDAGTYSYPYTFDIPSGAENLGCQITYKLDFVMSDPPAEE